MENRFTNFNFLLAFADKNRLLQMTDADRFDLLKGIFATGSSQNNWRAILELLTSWQEGHTKNQAVDWLLLQLESWSDEIRTINSSWAFLFAQDVLLPWTVIARTVKISQRDQYGNRELKRISSSPFMANIKKLIIHKSTIHMDGIKAIGTSPYLKNLTTLSLEGLTLDDERFAALFSFENMQSLSLLRLKDVGLNADRTKILMTHRLILSVRDLDLSYNNLDDRAAEVLAASEKINELRSLLMNGNFINAAGAEILIKAAREGKMELLDLSDNEITQSFRSKFSNLLKSDRLKLMI